MEFYRQEYCCHFLISSSRGSSQPRDRTLISCTAGGLFTTEPPGKSQELSIARGTRAKKISLDRIPGIGTYRKGPTQKQKIVHLKTDQGTQMLIEALFRIVKMWQHRYPSTDEWVNKLWYIHRTEYYSASKEVVIHATTGMNLENIILNQRSQS